MGKSRLLYEFRQRVQRHPVTYWSGQCRSYGRATPYLPLLDLLRRTWNIADRDPIEVMTTKVQSGLQGVGIDSKTWAPYFLQLLGGQAGAEELAALSPQARKVRLFDALLQVGLHSSRQQTLIIEIENLHWHDATSEEWLTFLVEQLAGVPIMLLVSHRPGYRPPWVDRSYVTQGALQRLSDRDSRGLVQAAHHSGDIPDTLMHTMLQKADGNLFFLEELRQAMRGHEASGATLEIPDTLQAVLLARIDRLPPEAKHLLQVAAVVGTEVSIPLLQAIVECPADVIYKH